MCQIFSDDFMLRNIEKLDWEIICAVGHDWDKSGIVRPELSDRVIREASEYVDWKRLSGNATLSKEIMHEFADKIDWNLASYNQALSESLIREHSNDVDWYWISREQPLSEEFIKEFADKVDWCEILERQLVSNETVRECVDKINWKDVAEGCYHELENPPYSKEFMEEFGPKMEVFYDELEYEYEDWLEYGQYECD